MRQWTNRLWIVGVFLAMLVSNTSSWAVEPYKLNPGDTVVITSFDDERLNRELTILPDGTISYLAIGQIKAAGLTAQELETAITQGLVEKDVLQPGSVVSVFVSKPTGNTIYVIGQVARPGAYTTPATIDVMQALSLAGGLTPFASRGGIKVLRNEEAGQKVFEFDYDDVEDGDALETNIQLRSGDTVVVP
ncbi:MAG: polysaccharide biosynthesis/export family protein [Alphaproteobacteria bacterium]|nr:polysaccharide biosynthesis/export family protein [Alphaproteobacteria bacterium]